MRLNSPFFLGFGPSSIWSGTSPNRPQGRRKAPFLSSVTSGDKPANSSVYAPYLAGLKTTPYGHASDLRHILQVTEVEKRGTYHDGAHDRAAIPLQLRHH